MLGIVAMAVCGLAVPYLEQGKATPRHAVLAKTLSDNLTWDIPVLGKVRLPQIGGAHCHLDVRKC